MRAGATFAAAPRDPASWLAYFRLNAAGPIEAIDDLDRLEHLSERLLPATSWDDLLSETK